jgi:hypothetical protein
VTANIPEQDSGLIPQIGSAGHPVGVEFVDFWYEGEADGEDTTSRVRRDRIGPNTRWWVDTEASPNQTRDKTERDASQHAVRRGRVGIARRPFEQLALGRLRQVPVAGIRLLGHLVHDSCRVVHGIRISEQRGIVGNRPLRRGSVWAAMASPPRR